MVSSQNIFRFDSAVADAVSHVSETSLSESAYWEVAAFPYFYCAKESIHVERPLQRLVTC